MLLARAVRALAAANPSEWLGRLQRAGCATTGCGEKRPTDAAELQISWLTRRGSGKYALVATASAGTATSGTTPTASECIVDALGRAAADHTGTRPRRLTEVKDVTRQSEGRQRRSASSVGSGRSARRQSKKAMAVLIHTERPLHSTSEFIVHQGWWAANHSIRDVTERWGKCCARSDSNLAEVFKWHWLSSSLSGRTGSTTSSGTSHPGSQLASVRHAVLADSDTIFQCSAAEIVRKFEAFGAPVVLSAEKLQWPGVEQPAVGRHDRVRWQTAPNGFSRFLSSPTNELSYPNGGLLMGSRKGLLRVWHSLQQIPTYPCCPASAYHPSARFALPPCKGCASRETKRPTCAVSSQACLQVALLRSGLLASRQAVIDENASLFLSVYGLEPGELELDADERLRHVPTQQTPCVLHLNGAKSPARSAVFRNIGRRSRIHWAPHMPRDNTEPGWMLLAGQG